MIGHLRYLGLLLPLFAFSSWAAEQNPAAHIAPPEAKTLYMGQRSTLPGASGLILSSNRITRSAFPGLMSPLSLGRVPPGIPIRQVSG